jgi:membrane protease YdiL (CAAX protease family)
LGFFLFGPGAYLLLIVWMTVQIVAAVGLLKLKSWGLYTTIALQCLALLNMIMIVAIPANRLRFQQIMDSFRFSASIRMYHSAPMFPMWMGILSSLPLVAVILFFLISQKNSFSSVDHPSSSDI